MYALREAVIAILRHPVSSLATLTTAAVSFTLLLLSALFLWNLDRVVGAAKQELEIVAFLEPAANLADVAARVRAWPEVREVRPIPKEAALKELAERQPWIGEVAGLLDNPLPDTLVVALHRPEALAEVAARLEATPGVEEVNYGGRLTLELLRIAQGVRIGAVALVLMLILNTFFSVMGTIRLSIESRKDELEIMKLVGATSGMILAPFVMEGFLLTTAAAVLATLVAVPVYRYLAGEVTRLYPFVPLLNAREQLVVAGGLFLLAILLGSVGGWLSSRARLKEAS